MTPYDIIAIFIIIQVAGYILLDKFNLRNWKYLIICLFLSMYIFVLPGFFIPDNPANGIRCGMPALAITLAFWIFGCGSVLITHLAYIVIRNFEKGTKKNTQ